MATKSICPVLLAAARILEPGPQGTMKPDAIVIAKHAPTGCADDTADDYVGLPLTASAVREASAKMLIMRTFSQLRGYDLEIGKS